MVFSTLTAFVMKFVRANFDANPALAYWQPDSFYAMKSGIAHEICKNLIYKFTCQMLLQSRLDDERNTP